MAKAACHFDDPLLLERRPSGGGRAVRAAAGSHCRNPLAPRVQAALRHERSDPSIFRKMVEPGLPGPKTPDTFGAADLDTARTACDLPGAEGDEFSIARQLVNVVDVNTCEGTRDTHALILARATGRIAA